MDTYQRRLRWSNILLGLTILFWLPVEDRNSISVLILSAALCLLGGMSIIKKRNSRIRKYPTAGFFIGLCVGPTSFLLMVFKMGLHSHKIPDFTSDQLFELMRVSPIWGVVGFLTGMSFYLYLLSKSQ